MKVDASCGHCGKAFQIDGSRLRHGRGRTCSRECQYAAIRERGGVERICVGCGSTFKRSASKLNRAGGGKYCTRDCRDSNWRGALNPLWQGVGRSHKYGSNWQAIRRAALKRDGGCQRCGAVRGLHVHHKVPFRLLSPEAANTLANLITYCASCHRSEEARWRWLPFSPGALCMSSTGYAAELAKSRGML